jgi:protein-arginine kinase activator protein McsA
MLCDKCHQREATVHLTFMFGGKMRKKDLCVECAPTDVQRDTQRDAQCEVCGAPAATGWGTSMLSADGTKHEESHFLCEQCLKDGRKKGT